MVLRERSVAFCNSSTISGRGYEWLSSSVREVEFQVLPPALTPDRCTSMADSSMRIRTGLMSLEASLISSTALSFIVEESSCTQ